MSLDNYATVVALLNDQLELADKAVRMVMNKSLRELCADLDAAGARLSGEEVAGLAQLGAIWESVEAGEAALSGLDKLRLDAHEGLPGEAPTADTDAAAG
ncbi:MAG: hypothetical protein K1X39_10065 [Thermoflexales bacterium]|nr:hypothetical protein [Thermoflexales bacterium]